MAAYLAGADHHAAAAGGRQLEHVDGRYGLLVIRRVAARPM
ncbi:hypothetical protein [Nocardia thailandica]|uniref:Uncharacterized protein n=1 Tax=Nocardia thailandica TaxID=257275 RepID=A0ABW6PHM4_9NOCA